jgi:hypothetical protein
MDAWSEAVPRRVCDGPRCGAPPCLHRDPLKAFVRDGNVEPGRLGHDRGVGTPACDERVGAKARVLFIHDGGDDETAALEATGQLACGADHRGDAPLHVLCAAAVQTAVADLGVEGPDHPGNSDRVRVSAEHQRSAWCSAVEHANHIRTAGRDLSNLDTQADGLELAGDPAGDVRFTARSRHE